MMMVNMRGTLWCIFGILFIFTITSAAFAQQEQQPDTVPADSQVKQDPLTEINKTLKELNDNYHKLDKQVGDLNTKVTFLLWHSDCFSRDCFACNCEILARYSWQAEQCQYRLQSRL